MAALGLERFEQLAPGGEDVRDEVHEVARLVAGARLLDDGGDAVAVRA